MSMHKIPLTPLEEEGLRLHGLPIGTPSQRSDTFRQGVAWGIGEAKRLTEENEHLRAAPPQQSPSPDCRTCANRGHTNGLSQETYCDGCVWYGAYWKKNHYNPIPEPAP